MIHFDCHAHVYEQVEARGAVRYLPQQPAPRAAWLAQQNAAGLQGGVIVQVSFLGTDNSQMLAALEDLPRDRFAGVAVVAPEATAAELARLAAAGVRGIRWNLVAGAALPDPKAPALRAFVDRLGAAGLHLEVQLESARLAPALAGLAGLGLPVVIDHMGLPQGPAEREPWLEALAALADRRRLFVKLSAPYRGAGAGLDHVERLLQLLPEDRFVWGSDWPHTRHEASARYDGLRLALAERIDDRGAARRLYGLRL